MEIKNIINIADDAEVDGTAIDAEFFDTKVPADPLKAEFIIPTFIGETEGATERRVDESDRRQHTELRGHPSVHQGRDVGSRRIKSMTQNFSEGSKRESL